MHGRLLFISLVFPVAVALRAQPQPENPSFEAWDNVGQATQEPQQWSSIKTSDGGAFINGLVPQLCWRSTDARTGQYSVNLRTVSSIIGPANGLLTNGRVHAELSVENSYMYTVQDNEQWRTALASRPDSLVGWFKATPQAGDRANVGALLHVGEGRLPAFGTAGNYVAGASWKAPFGTVGEWTRFSTPFQYLNDWQPQWLLFILTAGDSAGSQVGTQVWYDDFALIYNVNCMPDAPVVEPGQALQVGYSTGGAPNGAVAFTVELSQADGSFDAPQVIGSIVSGSAVGSIPCTLPDGLEAGTGYRIRVVGGSAFYAPVGCPLAIEVGTGLAHGPAARHRVRFHEGGILIESVGAGDFQCFAVDGRALRSGSLRDGLNEVPTEGIAGLAMVRVRDARGVATQKVLLP